jgi:molybdopterin converting factor small subunit
MGEMMKVKLFGQLATVIAPEIELNLPVRISKAAVLSALTEKFPHQTDDFLKCNVAFNQTYVNEEVLSAHEVNEIAVIPPVSGG